MTLIGETAPLEGAHQLLRTLKQRGHRLVLATTNRAIVLQFASAHGIPRINGTYPTRRRRARSAATDHGERTTPPPGG